MVQLHLEVVLSNLVMVAMLLRLVHQLIQIMDDNYKYFRYRIESSAKYANVFTTSVKGLIPTNATDATSKSYVDSRVAKLVALSAGTILGSNFNDLNDGNDWISIFKYCD